MGRFLVEHTGIHRSCCSLSVRALDAEGWDDPLHVEDDPEIVVRVLRSRILFNPDNTISTLSIFYIDPPAVPVETLKGRIIVSLTGKPRPRLSVAEIHDILARASRMKNSPQTPDQTNPT